MTTSLVGSPRLTTTFLVGAAASWGLGTVLSKQFPTIADLLQGIDLTDPSGL